MIQIEIMYDLRVEKKNEEIKKKISYTTVLLSSGSQ
jgi:hypothetical protein